MHAWIAVIDQKYISQNKLFIQGLDLHNSFIRVRVIQQRKSPGHVESWDQRFDLNLNAQIKIITMICLYTNKVSIHKAIQVSGCRATTERK